MRRIGCFAVFVVLLATAGALVGLRALGSVVGFVAASTEERHLSVVALAIGIAVVAIVVRGFRRLAAPVGDLVEGAGRIEAGDYTARVAERGPGEVRSLARAFNQMSSRLEANETQRRTFLADVAHELRTPLSVIQARLEAILDGVHPSDADHLAPILEQTRVMERLVADLRTLALAEAGELRLTVEPVDPVALVNETLASLGDTASQARVSMDLRFGPDIPIVALDPGRIRGVLENLVLNAIRHTPRGGTVSVVVEPIGDRLRLTVADTGPGIEPELLPRIFDRFVRGEGSHGSGLGLAIARDVITAHGGTITAESPPGGGAIIRAELPLGGPVLSPPAPPNGSATPP
ncbi:MAG: HAMP domain-containing protein [Chloroflexi bacterium]|nr:HAMP domain-containing protein [Chloroflexota bacterium]